MVNERWKRGAAASMLLLFLLAAVTGCSGKGENDKVADKFRDGESFILYVYGNSCPHCHKLEPVLDRISEETGVPYFRIDAFTESGKRQLQEWIDSGEYGLPDIRHVPALLHVRDGSFAMKLDAFDYAIENPSAELGYDIDEDRLRAFLSQADDAQASP